MQNRERNNKGFSLVELLVAITVLAIIVTPFMQGFVTAARTNMKAKKMQNATTVATNVMEELKANSIEEFAFQFNYPTDKNGNSRFDVMNSFTNVYEMVPGVSGALTPAVKYEEDAGSNNVESVTSSVLYEDYQNQLTEEFEFLGQDSGKYYFVLEGTEMEGHTFDTLVTLNANAYVDPYTEGYNEMKVPVISTPDELADAFFIQKDQDEEIAEDFMELYTSTTKAAGINDLFDGNYDNDEIGRQIQIDVEKSGDVTKVNIIYAYTYYTKTDGSVKALSTREGVNTTMYDNTEGDEQELKSLYLFYKPLYGSKLSKGIDKIKINNLDNIPLNIYLVKQRQATVDSVAMSVREAEYYCEVEIQDDSRINVGSNERSCMTIRTNLGENLYRDDVTLNNQYILRYSTTAGLNPSYSANNKRVLGLTALNGEEQKDRIYDVTVSVYEEGQATAGFSEDAYIEITGSKSN